MTTDLEKRFKYHPPKGDQAERYEQIRDAARLFASEVMRLSPQSRELLIAVQKIEEAVMWANAGIARNE